MRCSQCGADNADNRRFCGACGNALALACGACGFSNEAGSCYCGGCGAALAVPAGGGPSHERRQVAVLFVDLVGFTALTDALGAEQTQALLDVFFGAVDTIVEQTGGTVDKHIGDCVMAVFGAPRARGDDVGRAVRAAVTILAVSYTHLTLPTKA